MAGAGLERGLSRVSEVPGRERGCWEVAPSLAPAGCAKSWSEIRVKVKGALYKFRVIAPNIQGVFSVRLSPFLLLIGWCGSLLESSGGTQAVLTGCCLSPASSMWPENLPSEGSHLAVHSDGLGQLCRGSAATVPPRSSLSHPTLLPESQKTPFSAGFQAAGWGALLELNLRDS